MNDFDVIVPGVSVLMTVYNTKVEWLKEAIDSILQQTYRNFELVIVNDGSINEETNKALIDYASRNSIINLITFEKNLGRVTALNEGLKKCKNDLIFIFDSDDIAYENVIEEQIKYFFDLEHNNKDVALLGCQLNVIDSFTKVKKYSTNHPFEISKKNFHEIKDKYWFVNHPGCLIKKSVLSDKKINGYNENLNNSFPEDFDLYLRLIEEGYSIYNSNNILYNYRVNDNKDSLNKKFQNDNKIYEKQSILIKNLLSKIDEENLKYHSNKEYSDIVFSNSDYNYTIVTGLVDNINDYRSSDTYLDLSKELLSLDVPKIIFISEKHFDFVKKYSDSRLTQIVKFEKEDMYQFYSQFNENQNYDLPKNINFKKDTLDYFKCQNLKTLWLKEAKKLSKFNLENYMWIDFGIKHIHKNIEISSLFKKEILFKKEKIRMPRHFIAKVENEKDIIFSIDDVKWYALGGCLLINKNLIDIFHNLCQNELINIIKKSNKITWEVNIWAKLMKDFPELFDIYYVESHNENILKYMFENNDEKFDMYFSESINFFNRQNYIASNNILNQLYKYSKNKFDLERIQFLKNILNISIYKDKTSYFLKDILYYINNFSFNIDFFVKNLFDLSINLENESILKNINTIQINNFKNSNPCIFYHNNQKIINIRYVNYEFINNKQIYLNKFENKHRTLNINNNEIIFEEYNDDLKYFRENKYLGIEDIRLFKKDNKIKFIATTTQFNKNGLNQICIGDYLINGENKLIVDKVYNSPNNTNEKNWLVLDEDKLIYSYYPFTLYDFNLKKVYEYSNLPKIFQLFRGSANPIEINGLKYVLVHSTIEILNKRYYIHWILILNHKNKPIAYSLPFKFEGKEIEYCLSMNYLNNGNLEFAYSTYDNNSKILEIPLSYFNDKFLFI